MTSAPRSGEEKSASKNASSRVVTAMVGIPIVAAIIWFGGALLTSVALILALIGMRELIIACRRAKMPLVIAWTYPLLVLTFFTLLRAGELWSQIESSQGQSHGEPNIGPFALLGPMLALCGVPMFLLAWAVVRYGNGITLESVALTTLAVFYTSLFAFLPLLSQRGAWMIWILLLGVWTGDTVAYYAGRKFGRTKLTPLSPGKTREGAGAGLVATITVCTLLSWRAGWDPGYGIVLGILIGIAAPLGDLVESLWKRELGVKDLGSLLPGHGGVLDRCDSLLFAAPLVYFLEVAWRASA